MPDDSSVSPNPDPNAGALPPRIKIRPAERKSETARIDLSKAVPPEPDTELKPVGADLAADLYKKTTIRIDPAAAEAPKSNASSDSLFSETVRIDEADVVAAPAKPMAPVTTPPPSPVVQMPAPEDDAQRPKTVSLKRPKTVQMRPPAARPTVAKASPAAASAEGRKSETAHIELPPQEGGEQPGAKPKTIRIKRPDGSSAAAPARDLKITRPTGETADKPTLSPLAEGELAGVEQESIGAIWSVAALFAFFATLALVYILAAQSVGPDLPMPGRI